MAQSLADLTAQLRERLTELRPLVDEYHQLERAASALGIDGDPAPAKGRSRRAAVAKPKARAPRGSNKAAVAAVVAERPGVTVSEIAEVTGIAKPLIYNVTRAGVTQGDMEAVDLGGGRKGFKVSGDGPAPRPSRKRRPKRRPPEAAADSTEAPDPDSPVQADADVAD